MEVDLSKKYRTRDGLKVELFHRDDMLKEPIIGKLFYDNGEVDLFCWSVEGYYLNSRVESNYDLVEVLPYDHIKEDDLVMVWDDSNEGHFIAKLRRFAGISMDGKVKAYLLQSNITAALWDNCLTVEEYAKKYL